MSDRILSRATHGRAASPVRIVHLGLGNFFRAHQAWYTEHASDHADWGIAAFAGRSRGLADLLGPQDGMYSLITRGADGDDIEVISSVSRVHAGDDLAGLMAYFTSPELAMVTSTVTEAGYCRAADGALDQSDRRVADDLAGLRALASRAAWTIQDLAGLPLRTAPVRVLAGLMARRASGAGPLTILPCDNLSENGESFRRVIADAASVVDPSMLNWLDTRVAWATSMVDRITPGTTDADRAFALESLGVRDAAPVPTEPYSEWVVSGDFPEGRPDWESAGAKIVDDVRPYEERKLWMLNGAHSLLAYAGPILGCDTVAEAIRHPDLRRWVADWWQEAGTGLAVPWTAYAEELLTRFENPNIRHLLAQIAMDGSQKLPIRIAPTLVAVRGAGAVPRAGARVLAAWSLHLRGVGGAQITDTVDEALVPGAGCAEHDHAARVVAHVAPSLAGDAGLTEAVVAAEEEILAARR